eukprot:CAMPEP_0182508788 /NCGR_PEP_ID=MMETSP1321-20130603/25610_1 /TAXON_ID=91990 /ORGANISM="Bolidomonas sp., Strain RCC1657" /LENGTH=1892 /DNA_ID=CAMNT_0024714917 /DNA_START=82 /DNA_END=5760 /DNA_ORIENTATION=+
MPLPPPPSATWAWCRDDVQGYLPVRVMRATTSSTTVELMEGGSRTVPSTDILDPILHPENLSLPNSDLVQMDDVNTMSVIDCLRRRMKEEKIYTAVGDILIALNPYKMLSLYTPAVIDEFIKRDPVDLPPHVFGIAMNAFRSMIMENKDQSILISGESGAGKTEATKQCLHLLSEAARGEEGELEMTSIEHKILQANPVLEAFGNAKTVRNDNSSRFGKYMQVHFSKKFVIVGCSTTNYLLEKSRVVAPGQGERNFHVMYQLCAGAVKHYEDFGIHEATYFKTLMKGGVTGMDHVDDKADFDVLLSAMDTLGFKKAEKKEVFSIVATVLHLGQVEFKEDEGDGSNVATGRRGSVSGRRRSSSISSGDLSAIGLKNAARLLGVTSDDLASALTHKTVMNVKANLDVQAASAARDALAKELYGRLFNWIVLRINSATKDTTKDPMTIGILDIFGFEIFQTNSFEQLCINYANERLQQHFTSHTFDMEELLYKEEGVVYDTVEYISNQDVIDLISAKKSLFNTLDDEVVTPRGSDIGFLNKCKQNFKDHKKFATDFKKPTTFQVVHYAGKVTYEVDTFLEKNKDRMFDDLGELMRTSSVNLISDELFSGDVDNISNERTSTGKYKTQSRKFADQLNGLVTMLLTTQPHYIRCIKPNPDKSPLLYQGKMVEEQLLYSGVFEATDIRKKGYPFRLSHMRFYRKFWLLAKSEVDSPSHVTDWKVACERLTKALSKINNLGEVEHCQVGASLVLWRVAQEHPLREARKRVEETAVLIMQCAVRSAFSRHSMKELAKVRDMYLEAAENRDLELCVKAYDCSQKVRHRNHYVVKLERLKYCLEKEVELEAKFTTLVNCDLTEVDEAFEKLVEEGKDIGMKSDLFKKCEAMYEQVAEKRACRDTLRAEIASADPDENLIKETLARLGKLKEKYGQGMGIEEESAAQELYDHIIAELKLSKDVEAALQSTALDSSCLPTEIDTGDLEKVFKELSDFGPRKNISRELLSLSTFASKARLAIVEAVKGCSEADLIADDSNDPWEKFVKVAEHQDEVLDLSSDSAKGASLLIAKELAQASSISQSYHAVVYGIKTALEEKPCPKKEPLQAAIEASNSFDAKGLATVKLSSLEVEHASKALERVLKEEELMAAIKAALTEERLGPAETLPPGTSISTVKLDQATKEANIFGISHPDDATQLLHAMYMSRMRRTVKEVVVKFKQWNRDAGDDFVAANATVEALDGVLEEAPRELNESNKSEVQIGADVSLKFSVVEEIVKRMDAASKRWDEEAIAHHLYQAERLHLESSENQDWVETVRNARQVLATVEALREALQKAIVESNRTSLIEGLARAKEIGYDKPIVENAKALLVKIDEVIESAKNAVWSLDRELDMLPVIKKATNISFTNDDIELLRSYLNLPLDKFYGVQLEAAERAGDMEMMIETWTRLHDIIFESAGNTYHFSHSRVLKSRDEWVGRRFDDPVPNARVRRKMDQMLDYSPDELKTCMTKMREKEDIDMAILQFKNIMGYMGDRPSMYRDVFIDEVVRIGLEYPNLQDETYCQLLKQLSHNPNRESSERGWFLLETCIRKFAPSKDFSMYLESFIRDHGHGSLVATLSSTILKLGRHRTQTRSRVASRVDKILSASGETCGWLVKRAISQGGGKLSSNKNRYFVLTEDALSYYKNPESANKKPLGSTKVRNIKRAYAANVADMGDLQGSLFPFVVETSSGKISLLCADSEKQRGKWLQWIQNLRDSYWDEHGDGEDQKKEEGSWREAVDKNNGKTYFYNTVTMETTWVRPHEGNVEARNRSGTRAAHVDTAVAEGQSEGDKFVGEHVMKPFGEEVFEGVVINFFPADDSGEDPSPDLWRVKYSDGDEEDIEKFELEAAIKFNMENDGDVEKAMQNLKI